MEKIRLTNGVESSFITTENESWKFYYCETYEEAKELSITLREIGNNCEVNDNSHGWFVRTKK